MVYKMLSGINGGINIYMDTESVRFIIKIYE